MLGASPSRNGFCWGLACCMGCATGLSPAVTCITAANPLTWFWYQESASSTAHAGRHQRGAERVLPEGRGLVVSELRFKLELDMLRPHALL